MSFSPRTRPGIVEWFRIGEHEEVEQAISLMRSVGLDRLRTHLSWADYYTESGRAWYDWLLPKLAQQVELLPCIHYTPPSISENGRSNGPPKDLKAFADFTDQVIERYGENFQDIELWNEPNNLLDWDWRLDTDWVKFTTMVGMAANWARQRGKRSVLGGLCPTDQNLLRLMGERGLFEHIDVLGLHGFPGTWDSEEGTWEGWDQLLAETRATVVPFREDIEFWITETGYSTWRRDGAEQARRFLDAMECSADRVYWYALRDLPIGVPSQEGYHFDERHYHLGIHDESGHPKLAARLLAHGGQRCVDEVLALARPVPAVIGSKPIVITGGAGFIGCNLAASLAADGRDVLILDGLMRDGVEANLAWLRKTWPQRVSAIIGDVRDKDGCREAVRNASGIFHLAAQVAVTTSLRDPRQDFEVNLEGTINVLEAARPRGVPVVYASTNKVYGDLSGLRVIEGKDGYRPAEREIFESGIGETAIDFHTPYGCSKGAADQYVLDYARSYGLPAAVLRMSCIYGQRQFGTEDQGWVAHFALKALKDEPIAIFGDGLQVRDILHVDDAVRAYRGVMDRISTTSGQAFNLGGGPSNAVSLLALIGVIEELVGRSVKIEFEDWRTGDQKYYVSDTAKLAGALQFRPEIGWRTGVGRLVDWLEREAIADRPPASIREAL